MAFSERAKQFDLLLVPGSGFGAPGHVRIAYCVQTERIERALPSSSIGRFLQVKQIKHRARSACVF